MGDDFIMLTIRTETDRHYVRTIRMVEAEYKEQ